MKSNATTLILYIILFAIILCALFTGTGMLLSENFSFIKSVLYRAVEIVIFDSIILIIIVLILHWNSRNK